mmetsp:Transcript_25982/g.59896  ORF Transcript_25982/g.59896 Transcript_25982/m.59896 type:complete len:223 (-) Transcript_25982:951-1619(-)
MRILQLVLLPPHHPPRSATHSVSLPRPTRPWLPLRSSPLRVRARWPKHSQELAGLVQAVACHRCQTPVASTVGLCSWGRCVLCPWLLAAGLGCRSALRVLLSCSACTRHRAWVAVRPLRRTRPQPCPCCTRESGRISRSCLSGVRAPRDTPQVFSLRPRVSGTCSPRSFASTPAPATSWTRPHTTPRSTLRFSEGPRPRTPSRSCSRRVQTSSQRTEPACAR